MDADWKFYFNRSKNKRQKIEKSQIAKNNVTDENENLAIPSKQYKQDDDTYKSQMLKTYVYLLA